MNFSYPQQDPTYNAYLAGGEEPPERQNLNADELAVFGTAVSKNQAKGGFDWIKNGESVGFTNSVPGKRFVLQEICSRTGKSLELPDFTAESPQNFATVLGLNERTVTASGMAQSSA